MRHLILFFVLCFIGLPALTAQETAVVPPSQKAAVVDTARLNAMKDSIRWRLTQFFDIDMFDQCLKARQIANVKGFSLLKKNQPLADSIDLFEKGYETHIFVNSYVNSDQLWPRLLFNKERTTGQVTDAKDAPAVGFDVRFTPQGQGAGRVFNVDILNQSSQGLLDNTKQNHLLQTTNQGLTRPIGKITTEAKDSVNMALFRGIAALRDLFEEQTTQCNIARMTFEPCAGQQYGFDVVPHAILAASYEELNIKGRKYEVPWKSVAVNMRDSVRVKPVLLDKNAPTHPISFRSSDPGMVTTPQADGSYLLSFGGGADKSEHTIEAFYCDTLLTGKVKETVVGKLKIKAYAPTAKKLVPVLLNGASLGGSTAALQQALNDIYRQAAVKWTVAAPLKLDVPARVWDNNESDGVLLVETSPSKRYSSEMQAIIDAIKAADDPETYYVIVTDLPNNFDYIGYMPLKSRYAFLFTGSSGSSTKGASQTIAHELGHGAFYMKHIDAEYKIQDATDNLMNRYAAGTALWKPQWDWIGDPSWRLYMFQKEEEGAAKGSDYYSTIKNRKICHSETLDRILLEGKNRFAFRSPDDLNGKAGQNLFSIPIPDAALYDIYCFEHDNREYPPYRGAVAIIKSDGKDYKGRFKGTVTDFSFYGYFHSTDLTSTILPMDLVVANTDAVHLPFVKKKPDGKYYYRIAALDETGNDDTDDKYKVLNDCNCYDQPNTAPDANGNISGSATVTQEELASINNLLKQKSTDPNPLSNVYYVNNREEAVAIQTQLNSGQEAIAIDKQHGVTYLLSSERLLVLGANPDSFSLVFGLMKEQAIAGIKIMIELNQLLLENATIPRKYWDSQLPEYDSKYYLLWRLLGYSANDFAFFCGLYDGVIEVLADLTGVLNLYVATETPGALKQMLSALTDFRGMADAIANAHDTGNPTELNHQLGVDVIYVATFAYAVKDIPNAVSKLSSTVCKNLKFLTKNAAKAFAEFGEALQSKLRKTPEDFVTEVLADQTLLFRRNGQVVATRTPSGTLYSGEMRNFEAPSSSRLDIDVESDGFWDELAQHGDRAGVDEVAKTGGNLLFSVDDALRAGDEAAGVLVNGKYLKNPTATYVDELIINSSGTIKGKTRLDPNATTTELLNGQEYMFVIDESDNLIIGTRAKGFNFSNPDGKAPHPTLLGGNPKVKAAGTIEFRGGKIYKVDNSSGHFKPSVESLKVAEEILKKKFPTNSFTNDFKGFMSYGN